MIRDFITGKTVDLEPKYRFYARNKIKQHNWVFSVFLKSMKYRFQIELLFRFLLSVIFQYYCVRYNHSLTEWTN